MAGARATAAILAGLPLLGLALGELVGAAPLAFLCGGGIGGWFLVAGTVLVCCGLLWADHITERVGA
jgi:tight adherence protein B